MPRDYKHSAKQRAAPRRAASRRQNNQLPPWLWFLGGVVITAFFFTVYILITPPTIITVVESPSATAQASNQTPVARPPVAESEPAAAPMDLFDFYTTLPSMEIEVPAEQLRPSPSTAVAATEVGAMYQLQLGSFARENDASLVEKRLGILGIAARVERVEVSGVTRYRVRSGPYSREQAYSLSTRLTTNEFDVLIMRVAAN